MKKLMVFAFVFLAIIISFVAAHGALYFSLVKFFGVASFAVKNILLGSLVILGSGFLLSSFLAHTYDNSFTRGYYFFSGFWVGLLINILLFFALAWGIVLVSSWLHMVPREKMLAVLAIFAAVIYSIYGVWNAFNPKVTRIDVAIDALPKAWVGKKIVQISDVHLGYIYRADHMLATVEKINALNPEIAVITGDLFDGSGESLDSFLSSINKINAPTFFITGNHETYLGVEEVYAQLAKTKIIPLRDSLQTVNGLQFIGIDYPLRGNSRDIAKIIPAMPNWDQFAPSILLIHEPVQIEGAKKVGISLQLSGHTHKGQLFPFGFITSLVFNGYDNGFKREGSFAIFTSSGLGGWGPPMRTENRSEIVEITLR